MRQGGCVRPRGKQGSTRTWQVSTWSRPARCGAARRRGAAAAWRFEMRIAYCNAVPPALVESNTVASRKFAEKSTAEECLVQGPLPEDDLFKNCASERISRATPVFPLRFPYLDRDPSLWIRIGEMTSGEYRSHRGGGGIFIDVIWIRTMAACNSEPVWRTCVCYYQRSLWLPLGIGMSFSLAIVGVSEVEF